MCVNECFWLALFAPKNLFEFKYLIYVNNGNTATAKKFERKSLLLI